MATVLEIIQPAWRRSGLLGAGVVIKAVHKDVGLELLQDLYRSMANGMLGALRDRYLTSNTAYTACEYERVFNTAGAVVTLPALVRDFVSGPIPYQFESQVNAQSQQRPPVDGCVIQVVVPGQDPHTHIYDPSRAEWQDIEALTITSHAPMSTRFADHLRNWLAVLIADDTGGAVTPVMAKKGGLAKLAIASRYGSVRHETPQEFF